MGSKLFLNDLTSLGYWYARYIEIMLILFEEISRLRRYNLNLGMRQMHFID